VVTRGQEGTLRDTTSAYAVLSSANKWQSEDGMQKLCQKSEVRMRDNQTPHWGLGS